MSEPRFVTTRTAAPSRATASEQDVLLASSLLNTAQQVGDSTGLAEPAGQAPQIRSM